MSETQIFIIVLIVAVWLVLNIKGTKRLLRYFENDRERKRLNLIILWLVPFLWALIMILLTRTPSKKRKDGYRYIEAGYKGYTRYN